MSELSGKMQEPVMGAGQEEEVDVFDGMDMALEEEEEEREELQLVQQVEDEREELQLVQQAGEATDELHHRQQQEELPTLQQGPAAAADAAVAPLAVPLDAAPADNTVAAGGEGPEAAGSGCDEPDDMTCAICLERTELVDLALVKGCEHQYCINCILMWALCQDWCPQCKAPFSYLITYRQLDGTLTDFPAEESVVLLKRAQWFAEYAKSKNRDITAHLEAARHLQRVPSVTRDVTRAGDIADLADDWADLYEDLLDAELEEDEEIESYYFSSAAGRARVVLGNRRLGEGGYMRGGRMYARPLPQQAGASGRAGASSSGAGASAATSSSKAAVKKGVEAAKGRSTGGGAGGSSGGGAGAGAGAAGGSSSGRSPGPSTPAAVSRGRDTGSSSSATPSPVPVPDRSTTPGSSGGGAAAAKKKKGKGCMKPPRDVQDYVYGTSPLGRSPGGVGSSSFSGRSPGSWFPCGSPAGAPGSAGLPPAPPGSGRRAKRAARRVMADLEDDLE